MFKIIAPIIALFLLISGAGCSLLPKPTIVRPKNVITTAQSKKEQVYRESGYEEVAGKAKRFEKYYKDAYSDKEKSVPKKTLMERVGNWVAGLSLITFVLIAAGLFFAPTLTISVLWSAKRRIGRALRETVYAIKYAQAVNKDKELHDALSAKQSKETKQIVGKMKTEI